MLADMLLEEESVCVVTKTIPTTAGFVEGRQGRGIEMKQTTARASTAGLKARSGRGGQRTPLHWI
jgi:hypothetical protein